MPSDESEIIDLRKMQGPPDKETAKEMRDRKSWVDAIEKTNSQRNKYRENFSSSSQKKSKNAGDYNARMKKYDKAVGKFDEENFQSANDATRAWEKQMNKPSAELKKSLKRISDTSKAAMKKTKPLRKAAGGLVKGAGSARGVKSYKVC